MFPSFECRAAFCSQCLEKRRAGEGRVANMARATFKCYIVSYPRAFIAAVISLVNENNGPGSSYLNQCKGSMLSMEDYL